VSRRFSPRRAALTAAALVISLVAPGFVAPALADDQITVAVTVRDLAGRPFEGDTHYFDSSGTEMDSDGITLTAPPGRYTIRFQAPVPGYTGGFKSGDDGDPGLFVEATLDLTDDATLEWTVPIVDFPVHVVDPAGHPVPDLWLEGDSLSSVELAPGVVGFGRLLNSLSARTDQAGDATIQIFQGAPPASVAATDPYEALGRVSPSPSATSAVIVVDNPIVQGELLDPRGPLPLPAVDNTWVSFVGGTPAGQFAPWPYPSGSTYRVQGDPGDRTLYVSNTDVYDRDPPEARPASATLPGTFSFAASYHHVADATVDLTIPDAAPADIVVLGANDQPVKGVTMVYQASAQNPVELAPGLPAQAWSSDTIADAGGHFSPMLFGRSALTVTFDNYGPNTAQVTVSPGDHVTVKLGNLHGTPGAPQNITATAGDGKVKVTWDPPAYDGGSPITGYTVTASRNSSNFKANFGPDATSGAIRSLINGKTYTVTVVAKNDNGNGPGSAPLSVALPAVDPPTTTTTSPGSGNGNSDPLAGAGSPGDKTGTAPPGSGRAGYWLLGADGAVYSFGDAAPHGDASAALTSSADGVRAVDIEPTPSGQGYWVLDSRGRVRPFGDASHLGDVVLSKLAAGEEPASLSSTPTGAGYWVFTNRGRALAFGDAAFLGDVSGTPLNGPVLDSIATPSGKGYYMVASDGGIFAFGDARFAGSMGGRKLNAPVRSLVPDGDGTGYWLVASDGGVFAFDAPFRGSLGGVKLNKPVRGMVRYGDGYVMVAEDGGIFAFSDRPFSGSLGARPPTSPIVSVGALG
jgi:hypothetical protein